MNITSISYQIVAFPNLPATDYLLGNVADEILCTIDFTAIDNLWGNANLLFNLVPNSDNPTLNNPNRTKNLQTQTEVNLRGNVVQVNGSFNPLTLRNPPQGSTVKNCALTVIDTATFQYRIQFTFNIAPYITINDYVNGTLQYPTWLNNSESIKPYIEIKLYSTELTTVISDFTNNYDNPPVTAKLGNVGYFNERFNGLAAPYELVSFTFGNGSQPFSLTSDLNCKAVVKSNVSAFGPNTRFQLFIFEIADTFFNDRDFNENQYLDNTVIFPLNTVIANSLDGSVENILAIQNGANVDITFTIVPYRTGINQQVVIFFKVFEDINVVSNPVYCNVLTDVDEPTTTLTDPVTIVNFDDCLYPLTFRYHTETNVTNCPNHVKGFVGDWYQALFKVRTNTGAVVNSINVRVQRMSGEILDELFNVPTGSLPFQTEQPYNLQPGDWRQEVSVVQNGIFYECKFAFIIRENWFQFNDIVFRIIVSGTQNGLTFGGDDYTWNSPPFKLYDYELPINLITEPQAIGFTSPESSKQFYLVSNPLIKADFIIAGLDTLAQFKFRASNTNDLEAVLADLVAYFTINFDGGAEETKRSIHSIWGNGVDSPYTQPAGGVATFPKIEILDIETAMTSVNILWDKLVELGFSAAKMKVTGRLDKKLPPIYLERYLLHSRGNNSVGNFRPFITLTSQIGDFLILDILTAANTFLYRYSEAVSPNWDFITPVPKETVIQQILLGTGNYKLQILPNIDVLYSEETCIFSITKTGIAPANTWSYNFANGYSIDTVLGFDGKINISSIAGQSANSTFYNIRTNPNTAWGQPTAMNIATLNAAILALPANTPFEIQLVNISNNTLTLTYTYL